MIAVCPLPTCDSNSPISFVVHSPCIPNIYRHYWCSQPNCYGDEWRLSTPAVWVCPGIKCSWLPGTITKQPYTYNHLYRYNHWI